MSDDINTCANCGVDVDAEPMVLCDDCNEPRGADAAKREEYYGKLRAENERLKKANLDLRDSISPESTSTEDSIARVRTLRAQLQLAIDWQAECVRVDEKLKTALADVSRLTAELAAAERALGYVCDYSNDPHVVLKAREALDGAKP